MSAPGLYATVAELVAIKTTIDGDWQRYLTAAHIAAGIRAHKHPETVRATVYGVLAGLAEHETDPVAVAALDELLALLHGRYSSLGYGRYLDRAALGLETPEVWEPEPEDARVRAREAERARMAAWATWRSAPTEGAPA